jgi:hypothetical protein
VTGLHANVKLKNAEQDDEELVVQPVQLVVKEAQDVCGSPEPVQAGIAAPYEMQLDELNAAQVEVFHLLQVRPAFHLLQLVALNDAQVDVLNPPLHGETKNKVQGDGQLKVLKALQFVVQALQLLKKEVVQALQLEPLHVLNVVTDSWLTASPHQLPESVTHNAAPVPLAVSRRSIVTFCLGMSIVASG